MKYLIAMIFSIAILILIGCKNGGVLKKSQDTASIEGGWELRQEQSGMIPVKDYPPGNGNSYKFSARNYERFSNGNIVKRGEYVIISDATAGQELGLTISPGEFTNRIIFDNDTASTKIFFEITNDSLILMSGYFPTDGGSRSLYIRQ